MGNFPESIAEWLPPKGHIYAVGNGSGLPEPTLVPPRNYLTVTSSAPGFNNTVLAGLETAYANPNHTLFIRMDTQEHPPERIPYIVEQLHYHDLVVCDLVLTEETTPLNTAEDYHDRYVMPMITERLSDGRLRLSGAHGYMGFTRRALSAALPGLRKAMGGKGAQPAWSIDTLPALLAVQADFPYYVARIPATEPRSRPPGKCFVQLDDFLSLHATMTARTSDII